MSVLWESDPRTSLFVVCFGFSFPFGSWSRSEEPSTCRAGSPWMVGCLVLETGRQWRHVCNKGAGDKTWLVVVFFWSLACRETLKPSLFFFSGKAEMCEAHTVVLCCSDEQPMRYRFGILWTMQLGMLVDSNCGDPQAHCAAQGDAVREQAVS